MTMPLPFKKKFFFITTNYCWGGSEFLWYEAAVDLFRRGYDVYVYVYKYHHPKILYLSELMGSDKVFYNPTPKKQPLYRRVINKITPQDRDEGSPKNILNQISPDLVIISKGNVFGDEEIPLMVSDLNLKFITVNHIVTKSSWPSVMEKNISDLMKGMRAAAANYFVSGNNIELFKRMTGYDVPHAAIVYNPVTRPNSLKLKFPDADEGYHIAFVGRLELFHKGLDLLIDVIRQPQWQERPIRFNLYGEGPHRGIIEKLIDQYNIKNLFIMGYEPDKNKIWAQNHILILPSRMEGQSISLSEALQFRRTVIGTRVGGIEEYICDNETGFLSGENTVADLSAAMERAWNNRDEWEKMGAKAYDGWRSVVPEQPVGYFCDKLNDFLQ